MQYFPSSPTSIAICSKCRSSTRSSLVRSCLESRSRSQRRFANRCELHWLPVHKRIVYKLCLMSTQAGPNIPVVTFFAALNCHNASSAAGSNPQIFYYGTGEHELSHMAHRHLQFLDLHVGTSFHYLWNPLIFSERKRSRSRSLYAVVRLSACRLSVDSRDDVRHGHESVHNKSTLVLNG